MVGPLIQGEPMKATFCEIVEKARERLDKRFSTKPGDTFGLFRLASPTTGATLRIVVAGENSWKTDAMEGEPWDHVSVSRIDKVPTWEEMCYVKELFFDDTECVIQYHPPKSVYVNNHPNVLHLWRPCLSAIPMPPTICV